MGGIVEDDDDPLADAADTAHDLPVDRLDRRIDGAQYERAVKGQALEAAADDVAGQRVEVDDDVGELGNVISAAS